MIAKRSDGTSCRMIVRGAIDRSITSSKLARARAWRRRPREWEEQHGVAFLLDHGRLGHDAGDRDFSGDRVAASARPRSRCACARAA
eukprot:4032605-Prymnesium_polylepis.1